MSAQVSAAAQKTAKPMIAGVFNVVIGSICILGVLIMVIIAAAIMPFLEEIALIEPAFIFALITFPLAVLGIISVIGGIYGLQRKMWGWALAGSISTTIVSNLLGIAAIILTAISKEEFRQ